MKYVLTAAALLMAGTTLACAEDVKVEKKVEERPGITVQVPLPGVPRVEERKKIETTTSQGGCSSKTVERDTPAGEDKTTVKRCD
jgi:hypothetical protein